VNKQIGRWSAEGIIAMHDGTITIKNRAALEKLTAI
jgi:hypothetical protein